MRKMLSNDKVAQVRIIFFKKDLTADQIVAVEAQLTKQQHSAQASQENSDYDRFLVMRAMKKDGLYL